MGKIEEIKKAIEKAERLESKLTDECFQIGGYTSPKIRHLMNNLGSISSRYLEIGVHRGSLFVATLFNNVLDGAAVDNWSEFNEDNSVKIDFEKSVKLLRCDAKYPYGNQFTLVEKDCFQLDTNEAIAYPFDLYLYDGGHGYEQQKKAVMHFCQWMKNEFILCVDDYQWKDVEKGTQDGIKEMGLEVLFETELGMGRESDLSQYWNGFYVALLKKKDGCTR